MLSTAALAMACALVRALVHVWIQAGPPTTTRFRFSPLLAAPHARKRPALLTSNTHPAKSAAMMPIAASYAYAQTDDVARDASHRSMARRRTSC